MRKNRPINRKIAFLVYKALKDAGLDQGQASKLLKISRGHLGLLNTGKQSNPTLETMKKFQLIGVKPEEWFQ